ncbi:hypothetical protein HY468_00990 [Candidatus Roizmanbacteria bacterium]|nr:hypothetical protein [Candidatus Roizmanbacteria bacterium]
MFRRFEPYSKILIALVLALLTSQLLVREVFLGYSPALRPDIADRFVETALALINVDNYLAFFRGRENQTPLPLGAPTPTPNILDQLAAIPPRQIVKGVYAKETEDVAYTEIHYNEIEWVNYPYRRNDGTQVTIQVPRGQQAPPAGLF